MDGERRGKKTGGARRRVGCKVEEHRFGESRPQAHKTGSLRFGGRRLNLPPNFEVQMFEGAYSSVEFY